MVLSLLGLVACSGDSFTFRGRLVALDDLAVDHIPIKVTAASGDTQNTIAEFVTDNDGQFAYEASIEPTAPFRRFQHLRAEWRDRDTAFNTSVLFPDDVGPGEVFEQPAFVVSDLNPVVTPEAEGVQIAWQRHAGALRHGAGISRAGVGVQIDLVTDTSAYAHDWQLEDLGAQAVVGASLPDEGYALETGMQAWASIPPTFRANDARGASCIAYQRLPNGDLVDLLVEGCPFTDGEFIDPYVSQDPDTDGAAVIDLGRSLSLSRVLVTSAWAPPTVMLSEDALDFEVVGVADAGQPWLLEIDPPRAGRYVRVDFVGPVSEISVFALPSGP